MDIERRYATGSGPSTPPGPVALPGERARLEDRRQGAAATALAKNRGQPRQARYGPATSSVSSLPDVAAASMSVAYCSASKAGGRPPWLPRLRRWFFWSSLTGMTALIPCLHRQERLA